MPHQNSPFALPFECLSFWTNASKTASKSSFPTCATHPSSLRGIRPTSSASPPHRGEIGPGSASQRGMARSTAAPPSFAPKRTKSERPSGKRWPRLRKDSQGARPLPAELGADKEVSRLKLSKNES
eukprot:CAMPEP_0184731280 /NCGR_PEP_ID=MMETSP0314-20130426/50440_1 /TAXON_ID=38298 /ORGANISM="Rhodella maculata, Strain CCMP 736" /LENGTH=125 /DNA_ID=CAMNT_0027197629 /DNA_START=194 /DNA_END=571 /DNA_ORIENTATION=+